MRKFFSLGCAIAIAATVAMPTIARDHDHDGYHDNHHGNNWHDNNWHDNGYHNGYRKSWNKRQQHIARRVSHDWNWERNQYYSGWNRVNVSNQRRLDAQMRAQWLAYHNNNWNGQYTWNNYRDPRFLDYIRTNNPSLLTQLRTVIGF